MLVSTPGRFGYGPIMSRTTLSLALPLLVGLIALARGTAAVSAQGFGEGDKPKASVELIVPQTSIAPGSTVLVGVRFTMEPDWHIYWSNPGDAGQPPTFTWQLPGGGAGGAMRGGAWSGSAPLFPTPRAFTDESGIAGYGYAGSVIFPAELTVPANATPGQQVDVSLFVQYLVCKDVCLAETATPTATVTVGSAGEVDPALEKQLADAAAGVPVAPESAREVEAVSVELVPEEPGLRRVTIDFRAPVEEVALFPNPPAGMAVEGVKLETHAGRTTATFRVRAYAGAKITESHFPLVVGYTAAGRRLGITLDIPVGDPADE